MIKRHLFRVHRSGSTLTFQITPMVHSAKSVLDMVEEYLRREAVRHTSKILRVLGELLAYAGCREDASPGHSVVSVRVEQNPKGRFNIAVRKDCAGGDGDHGYVLIRSPWECVVFDGMGTEGSALVTVLD